MRVVYETIMNADVNNTSFAERCFENLAALIICVRFKADRFSKLFCIWWAVILISHVLLLFEGFWANKNS